MSNQQISNPPTAAYYLALIGGILGLIAGIVLTIFIVGIWFIVVNVFVIVYARKLMEQPAEHSKHGIYLIILSILGGVNILVLIGGILATTYQPMPSQPVAAQPYQTYTPYTPPTAEKPTQFTGSKYCPQCGNPVGVEAAYCPKCGTKMPI